MLPVTRVRSGASPVLPKGASATVSEPRRCLRQSCCSRLGRFWAAGGRTERSSSAPTLPAAGGPPSRSKPVHHSRPAAGGSPFTISLVDGPYALCFGLSSLERSPVKLGCDWGFRSERHCASVMRGVMQLTTSALLGIGCFLCVQGLGMGESPELRAKRRIEGFELLGGVGYGLALEEPDRKYGQPPNRKPLRRAVGYRWRLQLALGAAPGLRCPVRGLASTLAPTSSGVLRWGYDVLFSSFRFEARSKEGSGMRTPRGSTSRRQSR